MNIFRRLPAATAAGVILGTSALIGVDRAEAASIDLTGTIYDFNTPHPDFERQIYGTDTGIVEEDLGPDKKPVYAGEEGNFTTHGKENFDQWFRNVPDVNVSSPYTLTLTNDANPNVISAAAPANVFTTTFPNDDFFPIDNQLFGNQGRSHNYHFTFEVNSLFDYKGGETFTFKGDDDIWVFINNKLAIDLGGVHPTQEATVNLDEAAESLGITPGNRYDLDIFFAERHTDASNLKITTSLDLEPVPEPSSALGVFAIGALGAGMWLRRKPKNQKPIHVNTKVS